MHDSKQIDFFPFTRIVVPSRNDAKLFRQVPAFGQKPPGFSVMHPELLAFEVEEIKALVSSVADDTLIIPRKGHQESESPDIVHDTGSICLAYESSTCSRDLIRENGGRHGVFPAPPQLIGPQSP
jgi:hypothetical protein